MLVLGCRRWCWGSRNWSFLLKPRSSVGAQRSVTQKPSVVMIHVVGYAAHCHLKHVDHAVGTLPPSQIGQISLKAP